MIDKKKTFKNPKDASYRGLGGMCNLDLYDYYLDLSMAYVRRKTICVNKKRPYIESV